ncbi:hypothetical protein FQA39_LY12152 [Lamprigera yunnana]|nr:hypothetical protein FQA39_LY12152 [Lamprigera yunnana]
MLSTIEADRKGLITEQMFEVEWNSRIADYKQSYSDAAVLQMWEEALKQCDGDVWKKTITHTEKNISQWWPREKVLDITVEPLVICINSDTSDDSES